MLFLGCTRQGILSESKTKNMNIMVRYTGHEYKNLRHTPHSAVSFGASLGIGMLGLVSECHS